MDYKNLVSGSPIVLVEFYASWCPHCRKMMPVVAELKELLKGKVPVYQFDIDENNNLATSEKVESIPTFILYRNGSEVWRQSGEIEGEVLLNKIESYL